MKILSISINAAIFSIAATLPIIGYSAINTDIILSIEEPKTANVASGIANIRGWAISPIGIDYVEYYLDDVFKTRVPYGGSRNDIGNAFPLFPNADSSGYSMAQNFGNLSIGSHTMKIVAVDPLGDTNERTVTFDVAKYSNPFVSDPLDVDVTTGPIMAYGENGIQILGADIDGTTHSTKLQFKRETQTFSVKQIDVAGYDPMVHDGIWVGSFTPTSPWMGDGLTPCYGSKVTFSLSDGDIDGDATRTDIMALTMTTFDIGEDGVMGLGGLLDDMDDAVSLFTGSITGDTIQGIYLDEPPCGGTWHATRALF